MIQREIPIFFSIDDGYAPFLAAALRSAVLKASPERKYRVIILHQDLSEDNRIKLGKIAAENFKIEFREMQSGLESITDKMSNRLRCDYFTLTIYYRLFIPVMFPEYDKGIYVDSDVVLNGDIAELFDIDIENYYIGACTDASIQEISELVYYIENGVGVKRQEYINSGILLMNLKKLREVGLDYHFLRLLNKYHFDCIAPDQDYINALCNGNICYLGEEWDAMPNDSKPPQENPKLIHYNLFSKPWCYDGVQYGELFWKYIKDTDYFEQAKAYKENYSDEQKKSDESCLSLLISRGKAIPEADITFKKLYESGEKIRI